MPDGLITHRSVVQIHPSLLYISQFLSWVNGQDFSPQYKKAVIAKIGRIWGKSIYFYPETLFKALLSMVKNNNLDKYTVLSLRLLLKYAEGEDFLPKEQIDQILRSLKSKRSNPDQYVPTTTKIKETLSGLQRKNQLLYLLCLCSGIRKVEVKRVITSTNLRIVRNDGFVKILLNSRNGTKAAFFCYLPDWLWEEALKVKEELSFDSLDMEVKRKKLIPVKYARKWYYSKCIELGVPESIADFFQGRQAQSVGANHYLAKQALADKYYMIKVVKHLLDIFP